MRDQRFKRKISKISVEKSENESPTSLGQTKWLSYFQDHSWNPRPDICVKDLNNADKTSKDFRDYVTTLNLKNWKLEDDACKDLNDVDETSEDILLFMVQVC